MLMDRYRIVARHNVRRTSADPLEPLTVGNGEFAFTADVTGLQTFPSFHAEGMRLGTQAQWAWHTAPNPEGYALEESFEDYATAAGRSVPYSTTGPDFGDPSARSRARLARQWLRENPHRIDLGRIGFVRPGGQLLQLSELGAVSQRLDLWRGRIESRFELDGTPVEVTTVCDPELDLLAVRVESQLLARGELAVGTRFPYAVGDWSEPCDWDSPTSHLSEVHVRDNRADIRRVLDDDVHHVALTWSAGAALKQLGPHEFIVHADGVGVLELTVGFSPAPVEEAPTVAAVLAAAEVSWTEFWSTGGIVDLSGSTDPRAGELERRVVLSQYLTAVNCAGSTPPQETGLVTNSWRGKFHLEMHWWHAAHFALWNHPALLERSLGWYDKALSAAQETARLQGYSGARWPKQVGPEARESPSDIGALLVWQQPHPIYFAELVWRRRPSRRTAERFARLVFESAAFMASYATWDPRRERFDLGPPVASAQEKAYPLRREARNPAFELAYWRWGLQNAQLWRERLGLARVPAWDAVAKHLGPLPERDGRYVELEHPVTEREGHPTMVGALGFVPDVGLADVDLMRTTLRDVLDRWEWSDTWGWDYPLLAMTACRVGEPRLAVEALLLDTPKNHYLGNGHNFQRPGTLPLYLPGNGGLLYAVAMMAAGWDGAPEGPAPGFPDTGWQVRSENLAPAP
ncbi:hypothetical protein [Actinopolymorpha singaporensis]|uniref:Glycosyl hydrolase family 65, N-terminal domain n=1 Tax=Actinopolymorpha singaporensis TaxID=117157 RepID=A0A1H1XQP2_9ACTN|nr:hypothetical protein [Actinopolymorpha singaporensis]SDT11540.1 hypothetical protein SAMN04489717_5089 [Actinopolymorpha singaporensis]